MEDLGPLLPSGEKELEEFMSMLEAYQAGGQQGLGPVPPGLEEMLAAVKQAKGQQPAPAQDTHEITPQPGYVIKTTDQDERKVFINMCHSHQVPAPSCWADGLAPEQVMKALEDLQTKQPNADTEAMRFALSCSELQPDTDKVGQPCMTVDCILNSDVMAAVQGHRPLKAFVNELALDWVGRKHGLDLALRYKLPKMAYKGGAGGAQPRPQRVRVDFKALVAEVPAASRGGGGDAGDEAVSFPLLPRRPAAKPGAGGRGAAAAGEAAGAPAAARVASGSSWQHDTRCEGRPVTHMVVSVQLPRSGASSSGSGSRSNSEECCWLPEDVSVQLCGMQLQVTLTKQQPQHQSCCIQLPFAASVEGAQAALQGSSGCMTVRLPYLPVRAWVPQLVREAPHAFAALPVTHGDYLSLDE